MMRRWPFLIFSIHLFQYLIIAYAVEAINTNDFYGNISSFDKLWKHLTNSKIFVLLIFLSFTFYAQVCR